ncbi:hypothetical protein PAECIP111893_01308 [Paenibacillus plantiphilus]|uniref:Uncharacterized protein n=1 Tax=Paenibacillus plantiphilus TaxID=2905650 RepID=A0ABN8G828_9BACL|nr:hypothetical protein PAECIP111893_01308 [Paenibacillus plantiphilus]
MILYNGFVLEKGRVYSQVWKYGYRNFILREAELWKNTISRMKDVSFSEADKNILNQYIELCEMTKEAKQYYQTSFDLIVKLKEEAYIDVLQNSKNSEDETIVDLMEELTSELLNILKIKRVFISNVHKNLIHDIIRSLHNLPRYFFEQNDTASRELILSASRIDFHDALEFSSMNMGKEMKNRYSKYIEI